MPGHCPTGHFQKEQAGCTKAGAGLTLALHAWVTPEELLALPAGPASKAWHALALPCELRKNNRRHDHLAPEQRLSHRRASRAPSPHCRQVPGSAQGRSRTARSRSRWPGATCWGHSGHRSAPPHWGGTGTAPWPPRTGSSPSLHSPPGQCPGSCRRTLWERAWCLHVSLPSHYQTAHCI